MERPLAPIRSDHRAELAALAAPHMQAKGQHQHVIGPCIDVDLGVWTQFWQVTKSPRTPFRRMLPRVIGRGGASSLAMPKLRTDREQNQERPTPYRNRARTAWWSSLYVGSRLRAENQPYELETLPPLGRLISSNPL